MGRPNQRSPRPQLPPFATLPIQRTGRDVVEILADAGRQKVVQREQNFVAEPRQRLRRVWVAVSKWKGCQTIFYYKITMRRPPPRSLTPSR